TRVLRHLRLHALLERELRALRRGIRRARARRAGHHACRHPALLPGQKESMTLTELRYIVAVARERHFGRAAEACFVSQPTLSVAVKKLEEELGVVLFERGPGEVRVTPPGQKIVEQAQRVLEEASRIKDLAAAGRVRCTTSLSSSPSRKGMRGKGASASRRMSWRRKACCSSAKGIASATRCSSSAIRRGRGRSKAARSKPSARWWRVEWV